MAFLKYTFKEQIRVTQFLQCSLKVLGLGTAFRGSKIVSQLFGLVDVLSEWVIVRWPGWRCTTTRSTRSTRTPSTGSPSRLRHSPPCFPSPHSQPISRWIPTHSMENGTFPAFSLNSDRNRPGNEKASNLTLLFANHSNSVFPSHALTVPLFSGCFHRQPKTFLDFPETPEFLSWKFTLLTVTGSSGSPPGSRLSELL